jgi:hypothetical protein
MLLVEVCAKDVKSTSLENIYTRKYEATKKLEKVGRYTKVRCTKKSRKAMGNDI